MFEMAWGMWSAVCTKGAVVVTDHGDGTATCLLDGVIVPNCVNPLAQPCGSLTDVNNTFIQIIIQNDKNLSAASYVQPNISQWLTGLGINDINVLYGPLTVRVSHQLGPIPVPIAPVFLTKLQQVDAILIQECTDCVANTPAVAPILTALPGLSQVFRFSAFTASNNYLTVQGTAFKNLTSFSGLSCPFTQLLVLYNTALVSFDGLQGVQKPPPVLFISAVGSGPFLAPTSLDGIKPMVGCPTPINSSVVTIPVGCNQFLNTTAEICEYKGSIGCR
jgi:hypothetical protein